MARRQVIIPHIPWMKGVSLRATVEKKKKKHDCNHQGGFAEFLFQMAQRDDTFLALWKASETGSSGSAALRTALGFEKLIFLRMYRVNKVDTAIVPV